MKRFWQTIPETFRELFINPSVATVILGATLLYSFYYPAAYTTEVSQQLPVAVVDLDNSASSRALVRRVSAMRAVKPALIARSMDEARSAMERREVDGILYIPADFEAHALAGRTGDLAIYGNAAFLLRNSVLLGALGESIEDAGTEIAQETLRKAGIAGEMLAARAVPVQLVARPLFNKHEGYGSYVVPAAAELIVQQGLFFGVLLLLGQRRQRAREGGYALATPDFAQFAGMYATFLFIGMANAYYFNGFGFWLQDYPRAGNVGGMILFVPIYIAAVVGMAMFVGSFLDRVERGMQIFMVSSIVFFFLSGVSWPVESMPMPLRWLGAFIPSTPGISGLIRLNQMGAAFSEVSPQVFLLLAQGAVYTSLAWWRMSRRDSTRVVRAIS